LLLEARAAAADPIAREFGFRRSALNLVNWVSDQYSQYGTKVVSVAEREAIHTLEAILHTQLPIAEHTTDTHGATELVFALFDLLGLSFIPRLRDCPRNCVGTSERDRHAYDYEKQNAEEQDQD
jgi:TnpA family transposase